MWNGLGGSFSPMSVSLVAMGSVKAVATIKKSKKDVPHA
jgi:hypothetical protein